MPKNILEEATSNLFKFRRDPDVIKFEERLRNAHDKVLSANANARTDTAYNELATLYEERGFRNGFAAGIKLIMQTLESEADDI